MGFRTGWKAADSDTVRRALNGFDHSLDATRGDLFALRELLTAKRPFLLGLLQNPNLLEHETFTELLWAVLHLQEELDARSSFEGLPASDLAHLSGDLKRAYNAILVEWLAYMRHLSTQYPYLYSLAVRRNPYDPEPSVEVRT
ncbi:MAG: hypothetical protein FDZ70_09745 [Actinobacteria bacterium]|nr:MAG: hypothetical protein FDZ70_09745 [Actinomycetota bacterium]